MKTLALAVALSLACAALASAPASAATTEQERQARWKDLQSAIFGERPMAATDTLIRLDAPDRALDAAFVPLTLTMPERDKVRGVYLIIDDNPAPYAAHFTFGPASDASEIKLRVRVDSYTNIHAVVETKDGALYETSRFIKAAGGCSAPVGTSPAEAVKGIGEMRMRFAAVPSEATLMIRHPNFSGMQADPFTGGYTPARYIKEMEVTSGGERVFRLDGDISISTDPVITFRMASPAARPVKVAVVDSLDTRWEQSFAPTSTP